MNYKRTYDHTFLYTISLLSKMKLYFRNQCIFVPYTLLPHILMQLHYAHVEVKDTKRCAHQSVFWDTINTDIQNYIGKCSACQTHKLHQQREPCISFPVPRTAFVLATTDSFEWHVKHYLVLVDSYSGWYEIDHLSSLT